jgi:cation transport regulator ChaB
MLLKKIVVPSEFHAQNEALKEVHNDDVSGLLDSLTDFAVESAGVDFSIETDSEKFTNILKDWLNVINKNVNSIPTGIKPLAKEFFKERWKYSSFCALKVGKWETVDGVLLPTIMYFVDGGSIYAEDKDKGSALTLDSYNYYLGQEKQIKLEKDVILFKCNGRWFDKYPTPFMVKRGVYHNWKIIQSLKNKEIEILDQVIPYMLLIKKGSEALATEHLKVYSDEELTQVKTQFQTLLDEMKTTSISDSDKVTTKAPIRATNFDEQIDHLIPDLINVFKSELFSVAERNILAGLGFIDVIEGISTSRRESILNPKVFIEEVKSGVEDFKQILKELVYLIIEKNKIHVKYMNSDFYITSSPVKAFLTDDFKDKIRQLYERGRISSQTAVELIGEVDFKTEVYRRKKEAIQGIEQTMYPQVTINNEEKGADLPHDFNKDTDIEHIPDDKKNELEKKNYDIGCIYEDRFITEDELATSTIKPIITERYIRFRQINPDKFQEKYFRTVVIDDKKGIKAITGRLIGKEATTLQSYLFDKSKWTVKEAETWLEQHKSNDLVTAPYGEPSDLPPQVKDSMDADLQSVFVRVFNNAYETYDNETRAFRTAWSVIRKLGKKGKDGKWHRKSKRVNGKLEKAVLDRELLDEIIEKEEQNTIDEAMKMQQIEISEKKNKLLNKLLGQKDENI